MKIKKNLYEEKYGLEDLAWAQVEEARILDDGTLQIFFYVDNRDIVELLEIKGGERIIHKVKRTEDFMVKNLLPGIIEELNKLCSGEKCYSLRDNIIYFGTKDTQVEVCSMEEIVWVKIDREVVVIETFKFKWRLTPDGPII